MIKGRRLEAERERQQGAARHTGDEPVEAPEILTDVDDLVIALGGTSRLWR